MLVFEKYIERKEREYANLLNSYRKNKSFYILREKCNAYLDGVKAIEEDLTHHACYGDGSTIDMSLYIRDSKKKGISVIINKLLDRIEVLLDFHGYSLDTERTMANPTHGRYIFYYKKEDFVESEYDKTCIVYIDTKDACTAVKVGSYAKYEYVCKEVA